MASPDKAEQQQLKYNRRQPSHFLWHFHLYYTIDRSNQQIEHEFLGAKIQNFLNLNSDLFASEWPMNRHRYRPNLEVWQGSAEPPNLQIRSAEPFY